MIADGRGSRSTGSGVLLPLFDPPASPTPVDRVTVDSPEYFAFHKGLREGREGQSKSFRYDPDERVNRYYEDGWRIGRLFRPAKVD
jgi:hypothetical protein